LQAVDRFTLLADSSSSVPNLKGKSYAHFKLDSAEWKKIALIHEVLQEPANAQQTFSSSSTPTAWRIIPTLEFLQDTWENMSNVTKFSSLSGAINSGLENLRKWYRKTDDTNVYFICLALNPNFKLIYTEHKWDSTYFELGKDDFQDVFDLYYRPPTTMPIPSISVAPPLTSNGQYGHAYMRAAILAHQTSAQPAMINNPHQELEAYLAAPIKDVGDIIGWWGMHSRQYPTLSRMAKDFLAIQGSSTPSERAFSSGGITGTARRNALHPTTFSALQIVKAGYRNGHLTPASEAQAAVPSAWEASESTT
jgi:hypothetical protein